jgi:hypothetical protein
MSHEEFVQSYSVLYSSKSYTLGVSLCCSTVSGNKFRFAARCGVTNDSAQVLCN